MRTASSASVAVISRARRSRSARDKLRNVPQSSPRNYASSPGDAAGRSWDVRTRVRLPVLAGTELLQALAVGGDLLKAERNQALPFVDRPAWVTLYADSRLENRVSFGATRGNSWHD